MKGLLPKVADRGLLSAGRGRVVKPHGKPTQTGLARRVQIRKIRGPGVYIDFKGDLRIIPHTKRRMVSRFYGACFMSEPVDKGCEIA